jgi:plastocyanin
MGVRQAVVAGTLGALALPAVALAGYGYAPSPSPSPQPASAQGGGAQVAAAGNPFTPGSLKFDPASVTVRVGEVVRWTNTDNAVPHTASEVNGLWDLTGTYGGTPANPPGFGPGESVQRAFEAGTQHYICRVHPSMTGVVAVPVTLAVERRRVARRVRVRVRRGGRVRTRFRYRRRYVTAFYVRVVWAPAAPAAGQVFDVELRRGGAFTRVADGTRASSGRFAAGRAGTQVAVRARLRSSASSSRATDWSPVATVTAA